MAHILVVDDDEQISTLVSRVLETDGHQVSVGWNGVDALAELEQHEFDLLLIDLVMPEKGGIETIMEIQRVAPGLPIIVMSGKVSLTDVSINRLVQHYGALALLPKPFTTDELREAIGKTLT